MTNDLITSFGNFTKASAEYSLAMTVFAIHQGGNILKGLPTSTPPETATEDFKKVTETVTGLFDSIDNTLYSTPNAIQQALIDVAFNLLQPSNYAPATVSETATNVVRWAYGLGAQLIPGGVVGSGGPPEGWGPVNRRDAELF